MIKIRHITCWAGPSQLPDKFKDRTEVSLEDIAELVTLYDVAFVHTPGSGPDPAIWLDVLNGRFKTR